MSNNDEFEKIVSPYVSDAEINIDNALRPATLEEFVGQHKLRKQLKIMLDAAKKQSRTPDHILFSGPPGLGKTTLSMIVANELDVQVKLTSGPAIQHAGDLAAILSGLSAGDVLFIDEIHRMARTAEEMLYLAMEDFRIDIVVGKGAGASSIPLELAPFTLIGATTRSGMLASPLRDRFGFTGHLEYYSEEELGSVVRRAAKLLECNIDDFALNIIATRSRGTPRIANRLLRRVRDYFLVHELEQNEKNVSDALDIYDVDVLGLDRIDRDVLRTLIKNFNGGPVGLTTLAVSIGEEKETIEAVVEPYLLRSGLLARTKRGRIATAAAWRHLGLTPPEHL